MSYQAWNMPPPMPVDPTAVTGKRIAAWIIDAVVFLVIYNVLGALFGSASNITQRNFAGDETAAKAFCDQWNTTHNGFCLHSGGEVTAVESWTWGLWLFLALVVVFIVYQGLLGASLGKLAMGLRIVKSDGSRAGVGASAVRTLLWIVDAITCALPIVGGILILSTKGHRRVGDMAADTYVVPASQVGHPIILPGQPGWGGYPQGPPAGYGSFGAAGTPGAPGFPVPGPAPVPQGGPSTPTPWAPPAPEASGPMPPQGPGPSPSQPPGGNGAYEADTPIWDDARQAYIQYDSRRAAWLEFDDKSGEWKSIST